MTVRIELPDEANGVVAGIEFTDGVAEVARLSPNAEEFFRIVGASITGESTDPVAISGDGRELHTLNVSELRDIAAADGIEVPANARKAEIIQAITDAASKE